MIRRKARQRIMSEVNITPLVDTCLVLLIMFMIAAPIMVTQTIPIKLPQSTGGVQLSLHNETYITVTYTPDKGVLYYYLQDKTPISLDRIGEILSKKNSPDKLETVYIYSDGTAPMEGVIALVDVITSKGGKVSLVTENAK